MAKKIKLELTEAQLNAIVEMTCDMSAMIGGGDGDAHWIKYVRSIDRALKNNGYKRNYK